MKKTKVLYAIGCAVGGGLIGFFAGKLDSILGVGMFCFGVFLIVFSSIKVNKN